MDFHGVLKAFDRSPEVFTSPAVLGCYWVFQSVRLHDN